MIRRLLIVALALAPLTAHAFSLAWPLDCKLGETCFIQNYVEHGAAPDAVNFACDPTLPGLKGTDIRIQSLAAMRAGVTVRASADGVVVGIRNTIEDVAQPIPNTPAVHGIECGNRVQLQHVDGYRTQYCHMQKGSIRVAVGQQVKAGDALGLVGLSGETAFPHLHLHIMKDGAHIDPFTSTASTTACDAQQVGKASQLWATPVTYQLTSLLNDGMSDHAPDPEAMLDTPTTLSSLPATAPAFAYWVEILNVKAGDILNLSIIGPDGKVMTGKAHLFKKSQAVDFNFVGKKNSAGSFAPGIYHPKVTVMRNGAAVIDVTRTVTIQ